MTNSLLMAKVHVPPTLPKLVKRPRLLALLDSPPHLRRITLLSAPPGYGKTTLVADWIAQRRQVDDLSDATDLSDDTGARVGWYTLDESDNDLERFLLYLTLALRPIAPKASADNRLTLESSRLPSTTALLATFLNEIDERGDRATLVLDDYQHIQNSCVHEAVAFLVEHQPVCLHIVIISRVDPPLALALPRSQGRLIEIRQNALQFQLDEIEMFLTEAWGQEPDTRLAAQLAKRTEGWAAGLQMATISMKNDGAKQASVNEIGGDHRHLVDYFLEEVINRQPPAVRQFLLQTSILDRMSAPLCDAVLCMPDESASDSLTQPQPSSRKVLDYLERSNLFLIPQDAHRGWFRYHHLFAELLRSELMRTAAETVPSLHRRASVWYAANDMPEAAISHALAAGDFAAAARLINAVAVTVMRRSQLRMLQRWLDALPSDLLENQPRLLTYRAAARLLSGEPLDDVEKDLSMAQNHDLDAQTRSTILTLRGLIALYQGRYHASGQLLRQGMALADDKHSIWYTLAMDELAVSHLRHGNRRQGEALLLKSLALAERTDDLVNRLLALAHLGEVAIQECRPDDAQWLYATALAEATRHGRQLPIAGVALIGLGKLELERGAIDEAVGQLREGVRLAHGWSDPSAIEGYLLLSAAELLRKRWPAAERALSLARTLAVRFDSRTWENEQVDWQEVRLWLAKGNQFPAHLWLEQQLQSLSDNDSPSEPSLPMVHRAAMMAQVWLAESKPDRALRLLAVRKQIAEPQLAPRFLVDLYLLEALALAGLERRREAQQRCVCALEQAADACLLRPFLDTASPVLVDLLSSLEPPLTVRDFHLTVMNRLSGGRVLGSSRSYSNNAFAHVEHLTKRETEILVLIAQGLSNQEISARLVISLSTVKTHINNLYRKLGVRTRTRALDCAYRMGLLAAISTPSRSE